MKRPSEVVKAMGGIARHLNTFRHAMDSGHARSGGDIPGPDPRYAIVPARINPGVGLQGCEPKGCRVMPSAIGAIRHPVPGPPPDGMMAPVVVADLISEGIPR